MKIVSWNVNGLRAIARKGAWDELLNLETDIMCLQETKSEAHQLDDEVRNPKEYPFSYFNSSQLRKGHSGVAVYSRIRPLGVSYRIPIREQDTDGKLFENDRDEEGRIIIAELEDFVLINCYFPNGGGGPERLKYKLKFYDDFLKYILKLKKEGKKIIICGDINTAHNEIDLARPKENEKNTGFLRIERDWIDQVVKNGFIDVFRHINPSLEGAYTWWDMKTASRDRNVGWRLDYFFVEQDLMGKVQNIEHLSEFAGSDHCPIVLEIR